MHRKVRAPRLIPVDSVDRFQISIWFGLKFTKSVYTKMAASRRLEVWGHINFTQWMEKKVNPRLLILYVRHNTQLDLPAQCLLASVQVSPS